MNYLTAKRKLLFSRKDSLSRLISPSLIAITLLISLGCATKSERDAARIRNTPAYKPLNIYSYEQLPQGTLRAVMLPVLYPYNTARNIQDTLDASFRTELNKANLFEVISISKNDMIRIFSKTHISSTEALPHNVFTKLVSEYAADLVIFTEITQYDPYTPITIGLRSSLVSTRSFNTIWSFDDVFNAGDPRVTSGALSYQDSNARIPYPQHASKSVLQSPRLFSSYVAQVLYSTLPSRQKRLPPSGNGNNTTGHKKQRMPIPSPVDMNQKPTPVNIGYKEPKSDDKKELTKAQLPLAATKTISPTKDTNITDSGSSLPPPRPRPVFNN